MENVTPQVQSLADAMIRYLDWQSQVLERKSNERTERMRQAYLRKLRKKNVDFKEDV